MLNDLEVNIASGLIYPAEYILSPNCDKRPDNIEVNLIVIHSISLPPATYGSGCIEHLFMNTLDEEADPYFNEIKGLKVSAHLLVSREGIITQFVPFHLRAWHAGRSIYKGRENCNDFSIGIELEGTYQDSFEDIQYMQLAKLVRVLREAYPAMMDADIIGHSDIAPGRKADPGIGFNWNYFFGVLG